ncbi:MAG: Holliday junction resolvase RuvX [Myxococcota bacterium]|nr:Holliday junction resolvase RuvX [Myxococcota bacterium]
MRALGIDLGLKRTGIALAEGQVTVPLETLSKERKLSDRVRRVARMGDQRQVDCFVVGYPLETDGQVGTRAAFAKDFADRLSERSGLPVHLVDERYTTVEAKQRLRDAGVGSEQIKGVLDQTAAVVILESWLASMEKPE